MALDRLGGEHATVLLGHRRERLHVGDHHDLLGRVLGGELVLGSGDEPEELVDVGVVGGNAGAIRCRRRA